MVDELEAGMTVRCREYDDMRNDRSFTDFGGWLSSIGCVGFVEEMYHLCGQVFLVTDQNLRTPSTGGKVLLTDEGWVLDKYMLDLVDDGSHAEFDLEGVDKLLGL